VGEPVWAAEVFGDQALGDFVWFFVRPRRTPLLDGASPRPVPWHETLSCYRSCVILNLMVQYHSVDRAFSALADPTRRAVLERLGAGGATISELAEPFGMSLTGMRKHIRLLEEAELVTTEKVGRVRRCTLVPYAFEGISTWLQRLDRFAHVVERTKGAP
jgi:DNA-binding transcriptional ArsR family regulator